MPRMPVGMANRSVIVQNRYKGREGYGYGRWNGFGMGEAVCDVADAAEGLCTPSPGTIPGYDSPIGVGPAPKPAKPNSTDLTYYLNLFGFGSGSSATQGFRPALVVAPVQPASSSITPLLVIGGIVLVAVVAMRR